VLSAHKSSPGLSAGRTCFVSEPRTGLFPHRRVFRMPPQSVKGF